MIKKFIHGSEDSLDVDVFFVVERLSPFKQENKVLCDQLSHTHGVNGNIITIGGSEGSRVVTGVYKGTIDEVNNSLYFTYPLHKQEYPCPVDRLVKRDPYLKMVRVLRGLISQCSRTKYRDAVKAALRASDIREKYKTLNTMSIGEITDFGEQKASVVEVRKFFAFQIIQALGLLKDVEIYTKKDAVDFYPDAEPFLYRNSDGDPNVIKKLQLAYQSEWCENIFMRNDVHFNKECTIMETPFGKLDIQRETYI